MVAIGRRRESAMAEPNGHTHTLIGGRNGRARSCCPVSSSYKLLPGTAVLYSNRGDRTGPPSTAPSLFTTHGNSSDRLAAT